MNKKPLISLRNITKAYENNQVVIENLSLEIEKGSFVTILGPSGCGKSTLLKMIAGFESPTKGKIMLNNLDIKDMPTYQRPTATVFQDYALFPTMNVFQNIAYGLKKMRTAMKNVSSLNQKRVADGFKSAQNKSAQKLEKNALEIESTKRKLFNQKKDLQKITNSKSWAYKLKKGLIDSLENQLNDLDYWTSYWQTYPLMQHKKLQDRYTKRKFYKEEIAKKIYEVIELVGLEGNEFKMPNQLSGGMQQRVALARAIVTLPKVLLLDEPLSALDAKVRKQMQAELKRLHEELGITFILVTHDQEEALVLSDKVVVMSKGKIEQEGTSNEIYDSPANAWVSNFIGKANLFDGVYLSPGKVLMGNKILETDVTNGFHPQQKVQIMMRPEDFDVTIAGKGIIDVHVESAIYKGKLWELTCKYGDHIIYVENIDEVEPGQTIGLLWDQIDVHVM